jgi:hypothetical protein
MLLAFILLASIGGCSTAPKPFDYQPDNELKKGPGLFSGEDGAFTIYRKAAADNKVPGTGEKK